MRRNARGLSTCSRTSIEHTTSNDAGPRAARRSSTDVCWYVRLPLPFDNELDDGAAEGASAGSAEACRDAIAMFDAEASMPRVCAPMRAKL